MVIGHPTAINHSDSRLLTENKIAGNQIEYVVYFCVFEKFSTKYIINIGVFAVNISRLAGY